MTDTREIPDAIPVVWSSDGPTIAGTQDKVVNEQKLLVNGYWRLRAAVLGPDNALYVTTDNGGGEDRIVRITPL